VELFRNMKDNLKSLKTAVQMDWTFTTQWAMLLDGHLGSNLSYLAALLRGSGVSVTGTLRLNGKHVPVCINNCTLQKGDKESNSNCWKGRDVA
jgi:hypothetical protein